MSLKLSPDRQVAGILAPLFSLCGRNDLGVGDIAALRELIHWAADLGFGFIQMLPIQETGGDHSPYNVISSMAIEPSTISCHPEDLPELTKSAFAEACEQACRLGLLVGAVKYAEVKKLKAHLLEQAYERFVNGGESERWEAFQEFLKDQEEWLSDYCLFRALREWNGRREDYESWQAEHRSKGSAREWLNKQTKEIQSQLQKRMEFFAYVQWVAYEQWTAVREEAHQVGIALVGDVPVGMSRWSVDVWAHPHLFDLRRSSGAPPEKFFRTDRFTEKWGQNWGFPLYHWFEMSRDNFHWWRRRLQAMAGVFDLVRVDHALGFFRIYSFPWTPDRNTEFLDLNEEEVCRRTGGLLPGFMDRDDSTEEHCAKNQAHGEELFKMLLEEMPSPRLIAEDLGAVPPYVRPTLEKLGILGFKIPQWEREASGNLIPGAEYPRMSIATYSTHDHPPVRTAWEELFKMTKTENSKQAWHAVREMQHLLEFAGAPVTTLPCHYDETIFFHLFRGLCATNAWLVALTINDVMGLDLRFNVPGVLNDLNWSARIPGQISQWNEKWKPFVIACRSVLRELRIQQIQSPN